MDISDEAFGDAYAAVQKVSARITAVLKSLARTPADSLPRGAASTEELARLRRD